MNTKITSEQFFELVGQAKQGKPEGLNQFFQTLYQKGHLSLLRLSGSPSDAEEYFAEAVAKFWEKFVVGDAPLPATNIGGYIYTMAKFMCLDHKRTSQKTKTILPVDDGIENRKELAEAQKTDIDYLEEENREELRKKAIKRAIDKLGNNCQQLFQAILEKGLEKPRELFAILGLKNARMVTVLRYECTKQLKVKAAIELDLLLMQ